jgi:hypothetical protein
MNCTEGSKLCNLEDPLFPISHDHTIRTELHSEKFWIGTWAVATQDESEALSILAGINRLREGFAFSVLIIAAAETKPHDVGSSVVFECEVVDDPRDFPIREMVDVLVDDFDFMLFLHKGLSQVGQVDGEVWDVRPVVIADQNDVCHLILC